MPDPGQGEVRLRHTAVGENFADTIIARGFRIPGVVIGFEAQGSSKQSAKA